MKRQILFPDLLPMSLLEFGSRGLLPVPTSMFHLVLREGWLEDDG